MFGALFTTWSKATSEKAERHELNNWSQPDHRCADAQTGESVLTDRGIDDASRTKALQQSGAHFVRSLIFGDFFAH